MSEPTYSGAGVNTVKEEAALAGLLTWVGKTLAFGRYRSALDSGTSPRSWTWEIISVSPCRRTGRHQAPRRGDAGQVRHRRHRLHRHERERPALRGAEPLALLDYIAVQEADPAMLEAIGKGLYEGARRPTSPFRRGDRPGPRADQGVREGRGFDLAGACVGTVPMDRIIIGQDIRPGDAVIGLRSSGFTATA